MMNGELSYFDGSRKMLDLKSFIEKTKLEEKDFAAFMLIYSETDHIPNKLLRKYLRNEDLSKIQLELDKTELWAKSFAEKACENIINKIQTCED